MQKPLEGIKVVELSTYLAAPTCARILADWGADVIKIEAVKGDPWRGFGRTMGVPATNEENPMFAIPNANKKNLALDLKDEKGMEVLHKLLKTADVFITNNRLSPLKKMGLDYETLKERYPRLVYAIVTGFGEKGPDAAKPGFDTVAFWASGGFMADMRVDAPGNYPVTTPAGIADLLSGTTLFGGVCAALLNRERTGRGDKVSTSLFGTAVWGMGIMNTQAQKKYGVPFPKKREMNKPTATCYACADGEWMMISALEYARYFPALCKALDVPELVEDPRFATETEMLRAENKAVLIRIFEQQFAKLTAEELDKRLTAADIVHDRLKHYKDITKSEQAIVNHFVEEVTFGNGSKGFLPRPSVLSDNLGLPEYRLPGALGCDTKDVLTALGYAEADIAAMAEGKIIQLG